MNYLKIRKIIYLSLIFGFILACEKEKSITGSLDLFDRRNKGEIREITLYPAPGFEASFCREPLTGSRSTLMFGNYKDYQTRAAIKFKSLPDTNTVVSAMLVLYIKNKIGEGSDFPVNVYHLTKKWSESSAKWSNLGNQYEQGLLGSRMVSANDTGKIEISIAPHSINDFISAGKDTMSLYLDAPEATFIIQAHSSETAFSSKLLNFQIIFTQKSVLDTIALFPLEDATLVNYLDWQCLGQLNYDQLQVGNASGSRSLIKFDFPDSVQWEKATIHQANLFLNTIPGSGEIDNSAGLLVGISLITSKTWLIDSLAIDSTIVRPQSFIFTDKQFQVTSTEQIINFSRLIQEWTAGRLKNRGFLIRPLLEGEDLSFSNLYTSKTGTDMSPRLKVVYSLPASGRF